MAGRRSGRHHGGLATVGTAPEEHEWSRSLPGWHVVFGLLLAVTAVLAAADDASSGRHRVAAVAVVGLLAVTYRVLGVPALRQQDPGRSVRYLVLAIGLVAVLFTLVQVGAVLLFGLYPQIWMLLNPLRAFVATTVLDAAFTATALVRAQGRQQEQLGWLVVGGLSLLFALLLGLWITRVIEQSRRRAETVEELARTRALVAELSHRAGAAAERERLAAEIHDTLAQGFTSVLILLEAVDARLGQDPAAAAHLLEQARRTARENLAEARALVAGLAPPDLAATSLPEALARLVEREGRYRGPEVRLEVVGEPVTLGTVQEVAALRAAQEALGNARRHSGAGAVAVRLEYGAGRTVLEVADDGRGFDPEAVPAGRFGLAVMRSRVEQAGGRLSVQASPGGGARVRLVLAEPAG